MAQLTATTRMLAEMRTPSDAKRVVDFAETARTYAKRYGLGLRAENHAAAIKLRAARGWGEMLRAMGEKRGRLKKAQRAPLSEVGIGRMQSQRWQRIASLPARAH